MGGLTASAAWHGTIDQQSVRTKLFEARELVLNRSVADLGALRCVSLSADMGFWGHSDLWPGKTIVGVIADDSTNARWFDVPLDRDHIVQTQTAMDLAMRGSSKMYFVATDTEKLEYNDGCLIHRNPEYAEALRRHLNAAIRLSAAGAGESKHLRAIEQTLLPLVSLGLSESTLPTFGSPSHRVAAVRKCEDYVHENLDRNPTLSELSAISGMCARSLINAFQAVTGMSPMTYLRVQRLNAVHKALLALGPSGTRVMDVAADWGFWHMGHFTVNYRKLFGESPSETLNHRSKVAVPLDREL
jgi:AraC-like DNA-binding protein